MNGDKFDLKLKKVYTISKEYRCINCGKLLFTGLMEEGFIINKCPRCKAINRIKAEIKEN